MSDAIIRSAIEGQLKAWAAAQVPPIPIAYENTGYTPAAGQRYLSGFLMPAETLNPSQGGKHKHYHGLYQVSVYVPAGAGSAPAGSITKAIELLFACPTTIQKSGLNVHINHTPTVARGAPDGEGFYMTPVTIRYDVDDFS